ncbi:hypothetical protein ACFSKL_07710 [Belliella marina]|uniref:Outer membrane protein beta-barrel domain-containing protein n=1 Tax=Belliella marina TaxID=1644146 RepID=A0ABW4VIY0_9BACT
MKKHFFISLLLLCMVCCQFKLFAQNETETLFGNKGLINTENLGFFIAPSYGFTQMDGSNTTLLNLRGGISFKDKFTAGAYFNTSHNESRPLSETSPNIYMDYWTVGGFVEYTVASQKVVHLTFPFNIGYGEVKMNDGNGGSDFGVSGFFQLEPVALVEVNISQYVRFNAGAGYRLVGNMNYRNINQSDLSGLTTYIGLKIGVFR